jgi:hypothetical protein
MARHTKQRQPTAELARAPAGLRPAGARNIVVLEQKSLPPAPAWSRQYPRLRVIVHDGLTSLCRAWTTYTLKRAMADVASTSAQDYQEFGLDKAEILMELRRLRDGIESGGAPAPAGGRPGAACPLAIVVTRSARGALAHNPLFRPRTPA